MSQDDIRKQHEEDEAVLAFLGGTYGELKQLDGHIVGRSSTLAPRSDETKKVVEDFVKSKQQTPRPAPPPPPAPPPIDVQQQEIIQHVDHHTIVPPEIKDDEPFNDDQLTFNFEVTEKDLLFDKIDKLTTQVDKLHRKVDNLSNQLKTPVKKQSKKKSVEPKEEN
jgi:polyhydroxyalkanoate synthesis regulator phasin